MRGRPRGLAAPRRRPGSTPARAGPTPVRRPRPARPWEHPRACGADFGSRQVSVPSGGAPPRVRGRRAGGGAHLRRRGSTPARAGPTRWRSGRAGRRWEHPRACGADTPGDSMTYLRVGAPPRVRGRLQVQPVAPPGSGSTPARAGPTCSSRPTWPRPGEHPRACGADRGPDPLTDPFPGAPPRVRGRLVGVEVGHLPDGSTPARAGPTSRRRRWRGRRREHPRACGADLPPHAAMSVRIGAPPRVRGRLQERVPMASVGRSTPARAGPTSHRERNAQQRAEHPRACGADASEVSESAWLAGAPPRVRGRRDPRGGDAVIRRSTPARAGPTRASWAACGRTSEHPRACGADGGAAAVRAAHLGAPPRVRGRLPTGETPWSRVGSTPARAGPTRTPPRPPSRRSEHPRACGADSRSASTSACASGAPPRVRGRLRGERDHDLLVGSTPARAGPTRRPTRR